MQNYGGSALFSASDLVAFLGCRHRTALDLRRLNGWDERPDAPDAATALVQSYGDRHERAYLERLKGQGLSVRQIDSSGTLKSRVSETRKAMEDGAEVIFQAALLGGQFLGYADFLFRVEGPSALGTHHYEVADTKLALSPKAKFMVQLCLYADLLAGVQGRLPENVQIVLGPSSDMDTIDRRRTADFIYYARDVRARFGAFVSAPPETRPIPVPACQQCGWRSHCERQWESEDQLCRVANIRRTQISKLEAAGILTMHQLAEAQESPRTMRDEMFAKLRQQAALQCTPFDGSGKRRIEPLPEMEGDGQSKGLALLPEPNAGDLYFDMEGFPYAPGGLEYLFGVGYFDQGDKSEWRFKAFWAHDREEEKRAFEAFMDFVKARLEEYPELHIYHYAPYEAARIKNLSILHGTREEFRDRLLREQRLVDLYRVVVSGLQLALPSYSIKKVESYYRPERQGEVANAGESVVMYEAYRLAQNPEEKALSLKQIEDYNRDDVESTRDLHVWLEELRSPDHGRPGLAAQEEESEESRAAKQKIAGAEKKLADWVSKIPTAERQDPAAVATLFGYLLGFYWRCKLPALWRRYDRLRKDPEELLEDPECLALLKKESGREQVNQSYRYRFKVPEQETKVFDGATVECLTDNLSASNFRFDEQERLVSFTRGAGHQAPPEVCTVCLRDSVNDNPKREAIFRALDKLCAAAPETDPVFDLLARRSPRLHGRERGEPVAPDAGIDSVYSAVSALNNSHLVIQGPPGSGKTTTASKVIARLLNDGKRVGIMANSHAAINHLLKASCEDAKQLGIAIQPCVAQRDETLPDYIQVVESKRIDSDCHNPVGGTAWVFCRAEQENRWDYLFVDEASQVSLADIVAVRHSAHNLVLLGDQMQLPQPIQGVHPGQSGLSVLDYLMQGQSTVPADLGVFLAKTYRLHPSICALISEGVYEGRLAWVEECSRQGLVLNADADRDLRPSGVHWVAVEHSGNSQKSPEEANRVKELYRSLLKQQWVNSRGESANVTTDDILVVAPYNAQVRLLRDCLPEGARVGTVDKFQGQEAAIALLSMTSSDDESMPRGPDFLFSRNRLNVAVSRAKCLCLIVAAPGLGDVESDQVDDLPLLNFYSMLTTGR
jgi:predicted RecB family nuclease